MKQKTGMTHFDLSAEQIRKERAIAAKIVRILRPFTKRQQAAMIEMAAASCEAKAKVRDAR